MDQPQRTIGQKIAQAARAFEKQRMKRGRKWVAVFMNEDTIIIALHGSLTASENTLAQSPAGATQVQEFHNRLFSNISTTFRRKIKSIAGLEVCDTTAEIDPTASSVVQVLTTDTVGEDFLLAAGVSAGTRSAQLAGN